MAIKLLVNACTSNFMREKEIPACYAALLATELTIRDGVSPYSANAFVVYGMVEILFRKRCLRAKSWYDISSVNESNQVQRRSESHSRYERNISFTLEDGDPRD
jgi:hypothetical protein